MYETTNGKGIQGNWCHMNTLINNVQKINISEKGPYTFKDLAMKNREINNWTRRRPMPSSTGRVTTSPWGWSSTSRHIENWSKTILSTIPDRWWWAVPRRIHWHLKDKGKLKFVKTSAASEIFKDFWEHTSICSVNNKLYICWWLCHN